MEDESEGQCFYWGQTGGSEFGGKRDQRQVVLSAAEGFMDLNISVGSVL